jgi:hypothetical protein
MTFTLSEAQEQKYNDWKEEYLKDVSADELGVREIFMFIPCTAGMAVKVVCGEHQIDLTEYDKLNNKKKTCN